MSHFTTLVLITKEEYEQGCEAAVSRLLDPFCEHTQVLAYQRKCSCTDFGLYLRATDHAVGMTGHTIKDLREQFRTMPDSRYTHDFSNEKEVQAAWQALIKPYTDALDAYQELHRSTAHPDPDCDTCAGTGFYESTYNPLSKWDWWVIGGRWDSDLKNWAYCGNSNAASAGDLAGKYTPHAILTPNGKWNEHGEMGWFAVVTNENDNWSAIAEELLRHFGQHIAVLCDLHI